MRICVLGLWHLGTVTAACLASRGHQVVGLDFDENVIMGLAIGQPPLFEPGLQVLVGSGLSAGHLRFTTDIRDAVKDCELLWVSYDTPVDDDDNADVDYVFDKVMSVLPSLANGTMVLVSSQLPVGSIRRLETALAKLRPDAKVSFACSPENLRLGKAIQIFLQPDRVVVGVRSGSDKSRIQNLLKDVTTNIEWMSVESAEMTKHSINAFLAMSVTFANEIAVLCERVGADAKEVERGLKSESRIGPQAYLSPGGPFAGGTLARDLAFLSRVGLEHHQTLHLLPAVRASNDEHKGWVSKKIQSILPNLVGQRIAIWGLTYKPGTNTLRRSSSLETCQWLITQGAMVSAHDPVIRELPPELSGKMELCTNVEDSLSGAAALVVQTEWPDYLQLDLDSLFTRMQTPVVIDANRFLVKQLGKSLAAGSLRYYAVGQPE